jgi:4-oxalmesaconate hydratase
MIIDCHAHVSAPQALWSYKALLVSHRGSHGRGAVRVSDEEILAGWNHVEIGPDGHLDALRRTGTDLQLISPRPFQMMHSEKPGKLVQWFTAETNKIIHRSCRLMPERFFGVGGLPQEAGEPVNVVFEELDRCVKEYGFKGVLLNPDPFENSGVKAPPLGDRYWYPLYEKLCEYDIVGHIHASGSRHPDREPYTLHFVNEETTAVYGLVSSDVFTDFPSLKILVSHGGGAIPFQIGRFDSGSMRRGPEHRFRKKMRNLYYDTVLYSPEALELLIKVVGPDRCLFGSECPGVGSTMNPDTGRTFDDIRPYIEAIDWLTPAERKAILEDNARKLFKLDV